MSSARSLSLLAPFAVCALIVGWAMLAAASLQAATLSVLVYAVANFIVYTDALDFVLRLYVWRRHTATASPGSASRDLSMDLPAILLGRRRRIVPRPSYAIIASVFNLGYGVEDFVRAFAPYRERMWLISDGSTDHTVTQLHQAGWRCFDDGVNRRKPGALRLLLEQLPAHIETVMVVDPDIRIRRRRAGSTADLERVIDDFQQSGAAAVCPRVMIEPDGFLARFQAFEYALSFRAGRASLADYGITSGVSIYRRDALQRALQAHSLSVYAEDLEIAVLLLAEGERIYYDGRLVVSTEGAGSLGRWFSQRVGWYHGLLKVCVQRLSEIWRIRRLAPFAMYHFVVYLGGLTLALHFVKIVSAALLVSSFLGGVHNIFVVNLFPKDTLTNPGYFAGAITSYIALGVVALFTVVPRSERAYVAPIVPLYLLYALTHIVPMTVGFGNFVALRLWGRRLYRDYYEPDTSADEAALTRRLVAGRAW